MIDQNDAPIITHKDYLLPSVFTPENLLREARRQKSIPEGTVPKICILDPDGDIVQNLVSSGLAERNRHWACYHTSMYKTSRMKALSLASLETQLGHPSRYW